MERLKLIDDIRTKAVSLMQEDSSLSYEDASQQAKIALVGSDVLITKYHQPMELENSILEIARKELSPDIRVDLYQEAQLREMVVANRLGVDLESFINIFLSPEQIKFITLIALNGMDVTPYAFDLHFDPKEEMKKLTGQEVSLETPSEKPFQKVYTPDFQEAA